MKPRRKICVVLIDRANYGRLKPVMQAIEAHPELELQVLAAGTMVLERFDMPVNVVRKDFRVDAELHIEVEGSTPTTMAKSVGFGVVEFASEFNRLKPDVVLIVGDRYEALAATIAAAYMNLCIAHVQGGEVSGSIDESARHAITKFAHFHFPSTKRSAEFLVRMGEDPKTILAVGCPTSDLARTLSKTLEPQTVNGVGSGREIDLDEPFNLVLFHPSTTDYGLEHDPTDSLLTVLNELGKPTIILWPNIDAGNDQISRTIRTFRKTYKPVWLRTVTNLNPDAYLGVLSRAACAIGNSSSFVRDAGFFGTPVVLVGNRQLGREADEHVVPCGPSVTELRATIAKQLEHGRYAPSTLYGDGHVSERIAAGLAKLVPYRQKRLHYIFEGAR